MAFSNSTDLRADKASNPPTKAEALIQRIRRRGYIEHKNFVEIITDDSLAFQDVFGQNVLIQVEFDVAKIGEHTHYVFVPDNGEDAEIITSFPQGTKLRVSGPTPWAESGHAPTRRRSRHRIKVIAKDFSRDKWMKMEEMAQQINDADLNYHFIFQNSNSVAATLADCIGLEFEDLKGGGLNVGARNLLHDEMAGGQQTYPFLIRHGTSYSKGAASRILPQNTSAESNA